jgi:hypothetical protein
LIVYHDHCIIAHHLRMPSAVVSRLRWLRESRKPHVPNCLESRRNYSLRVPSCEMSPPTSRRTCPILSAGVFMRCTVRCFPPTIQACGSCHLVFWGLSGASTIISLTASVPSLSERASFHVRELGNITSLLPIVNTLGRGHLSDGDLSISCQLRY